MKILAPFVVAAASLFLASNSVHATSLPRVDTAVHRKLKHQGTVNIIVTMRETTGPVLESFQKQEASYTSRGEKITALVETLESHASSTQAEITKLLTQEADGATASEVRRLWISNQVLFRDASLGLVEKLASLSSVASIEEEEVIPVPPLDETPSNNSSRRLEQTNIEWGVDKVRAPQVWATGVRGEGVVVGQVDSGVRGTHTYLKDSFRGDYGWFDPTDQHPEPFDNQGHGTYTMGSMIAPNGVGVAPGAKWMACRGCHGACDGGFLLADLLACAQFMLCPTDPFGENRDCSKAPHVINNSFGGTGPSHFGSSVQVWRAAGIIPVFANGNLGPKCNSLVSEALEPNVISVGSVDSSNKLATSSSRGPAVDGLLKPEISAPGVNIRSTGFDSDTKFTVASGTSIAAPHVTAVIALLLSAFPTLTYDLVKAAITSSAETKTLQSTGEQCEGVPSDVFPNFHYGYGRIDAFNAFQTAMRLAPRPPTPSAPAAGKCSGQDAKTCEAAFLCSWSELQQSCVRWWA